MLLCCLARAPRYSDAATPYVAVMPCPPAVVQWSIPGGIEISPECRDLLTRMLVRNPDERITMAEIHRHPWFIANLPVEVGRGTQRRGCPADKQAAACTVAVLLMR